MSIKNEREREREQERNLELRKLQPSIHFPFPRVRTEKLLPRNQLRSRGAVAILIPDVVVQVWTMNPPSEGANERSCKFNFGVQIHYSSAASPDLKSCNGKTDTCSYVIGRQICCWELGNRSRPNKSACYTQNLSPHIENSCSTFLLQFWQKLRTAFFPIWHRTVLQGW